MQNIWKSCLAVLQPLTSIPVKRYIVENFFFIVVEYLHALVQQPIIAAASPQANVMSVDSILQQDVQIRCSDRTALHWRQHLDLIRIDTIGFRQASFDQIHNSLCSFLRILFFQKEKI